jgi:hypothetical protein
LIPISAQLYDIVAFKNPGRGTVMRVSAIAAACGLTVLALAPGAAARQWERAGSGWHFDAKDVKTGLKDGVVNLETTVVFQLLQDDSGKKPAASAEPTAQLYILCDSRQYRLWDVKTATEMGPMSTQMFDVAQSLEAYCDRIGKSPEEKPRGNRPPGG